MFQQRCGVTIKKKKKRPLENQNLPPNVRCGVATKLLKVLRKTIVESP